MMKPYLKPSSRSIRVKTESLLVSATPWEDPHADSKDNPGGWSDEDGQPEQSDLAPHPFDAWEGLK